MCLQQLQQADLVVAQGQAYIPLIEHTPPEIPHPPEHKIHARLKHKQSFYS
jgi:hypothetical protein